MPGIYQVAVGANVAYVTKDGRYIIRGDIYDAETSDNVSEETRARARVTMLDGVDPASMIVFKPASGEVKHKITIFTDIDCGYCRQFHREIDKVTALGIEVHYLFYPRTGPNTESWTKADQVWCAPNHNSALTRAKLGGEIPEGAACNTPVEAHYQLGQLHRRAWHAGDLHRDRRADRRLPAAGDTRQGARRPERDHRRIARA